MEETNATALPQAPAASSPAGAENTDGAGQKATVPIKFNKEIKHLTAEEAGTLAQKGLKFEMIENDFLKLKTLAGNSKMSVPEYISELEKEQAQKRKEQILSEYKGSEALARRIAELEGGGETDGGLDELREYFPTVKSLSDLPHAVVESARLKGENLLNAYLKYRIVKKRQADEERLFERDAKDASVGSLKSGGENTDDAFLRALWGK